MPQGELDREILTMPPTVSRAFLLHHGCCPIARREDGVVVVAVTEDCHREAIPELGLAFGAPVVEEVVGEAELTLMIERHTSASERTTGLEARGGASTIVSDVRDLANQPPVIRFVNFLIQESYEARASDIHLESSRAGLSARIRVDGVLSPGPTIPNGLDQAVISRIKLLADLDIAERRRPQDGRIRIHLNDRELDIRVSTVPTMHGESVVLRLLYQRSQVSALSELGLGPVEQGAVEHLVARQHGMILATGPTGSGKTTTLHTALGLRAGGSEKVITIEDPVEYELPGAAQVPVGQQTGIGFPSALRSVLRQDPDVILVGELRDSETAHLAIQAALTGHLVLSTLHTNHAAGAVPRLLELGVESFLLTATVRAVLAQRLVRRICVRCSGEYEPSAELIESMVQALRQQDRHDVVALLSGGTSFRRGAGCSACKGSGFLGRVGIFELLLLTDEIRAVVSSKGSQEDLHALAVNGGMVPMRVDGWRKVQSGLTTIEEVARACQ